MLYMEPVIKYVCRSLLLTSNFRHSNAKQHPDGNDWKLNVTRLEDAWLLYRLICAYSDQKMLEAQDFSVCTVAGNRWDIEYLCQRIVLKAQSTTPLCVQHQWCSEGMVTIDGNEKLTRAMCAAPKEKVKCPLNHINLVQCYSRSPISGGNIKWHQNIAHFTSIWSHQHLIAIVWKSHLIWLYAFLFILKE